MLCSFLASHEVSVSYSNISENSVDTITCTENNVNEMNFLKENVILIK